MTKTKKENLLSFAKTLAERGEFEAIQGMKDTLYIIYDGTKAMENVKELISELTELQGN